jgi:hypothetical protein
MHIVHHYAHSIHTRDAIFGTMVELYVMKVCVLVSLNLDNHKQRYDGLSLSHFCYGRDGVTDVRLWALRAVARGLFTHGSSCSVGSSCSRLGTCPSFLFPFWINTSRDKAI